MVQTKHKNLQIFKNTSKEYELRFSKDNSPLDISGWTIYFTAKINMADVDANAAISKTVTSHVEATNGKTLIELSPTDTDIDPKPKYWYSIDYKDDEGNEEVILHGKLQIIDSVRNTR